MLEKWKRRQGSGLVAITALLCVSALGVGGCGESAHISWEAMDDAELTHELRRAQATGAMKMLTCVQQADEAACEDADAIAKDVAEMAEIFCARQPGTDDCRRTVEFRENMDRMKAVRGLAKGVDDAAEDLTSYKPR